MPVEQSEIDNPNDHEFINVSGYRFVNLDNLEALRDKMRADFADIGLKGTVLLAKEGINAALVGTDDQIIALQAWFNQDPHFKELWLKQSASGIIPFSKLKIRIRPEIITFQPDATQPVSPADNPAPAMQPTQLKAWLDEKKSFSLLDTRNAYETDSGTFSDALDLKLNTFRDFAGAVDTALENGTLDKNEPVVTFCTGGIRCEKAAPYLIEQGFKEVYQVEGGILNYFEQCGGEHWDGDCFVFDDRVEINPRLEPTGAYMCRECHRAVPARQICKCEAVSPW